MAAVISRAAILGLLSVLVAPLVVTAGTVTTAQRLPAPRTLLSTRQPIYAFTQDGDRMAWVADDGRVRVRSLSLRRTWLVGTVDRDRASSSMLALAGNRALWSWDAGGNSTESPVVLGAPGHKQVTIAHLGGGLRGMGDGHDLVDVAGDGSTLAYGWVAETCPGQPYGCNTFDAPLVVDGGGVSLATWAPAPRPFSPPVIQGAPPPVLFAATQGRVAVAPARASGLPGTVPRMIEDGPVEVYDLAGNRLLHVPMLGLVRHLALWRSKLAVILERPEGMLVAQQFIVPNPSFVAGARLPLGATDIATGSGGTTFRAGRSVYVLGIESVRLVARTAAHPIGLSIEGRRIAWAENVHGKGRIQAVTAP